MVAAQDIGNYPGSLKEGLEYLQLAQQVKDIRNTSHAYEGIARLYTLTADYNKAIFYLHKEEGFIIEAGASSRQIYTRLATCYSKLNRNDSAKHYADLAYKAFARDYGGEAMIPAGALDDLGGIYLQLGEDSVALNYLRRSYAVFSAGTDYNNFAETTTYLSRYFKKNGPADSLFYYAVRGFTTAKANNFPEYLTETSDMIAAYYSGKGKLDSAYYFQSAGYEAFKKIYNQESVRSFQNLSNLEQQRLDDIAREKQLAKERYNANLKLYGLIAALVTATIIVVITYRNNLQKQKANALLKDEKQKVENTLAELKSTQQQLIQSEKMASLGELTAGIAHEIQNPLNFVNNFSEVNQEMVDEATEEINKGNYDEVKFILNDIKENSEKINHHGKRADSIVKGMLQHSRKSEGKKEPTDINALCDEYLRLSYHGLRAKDKSFNADFKTDLDETIGKINIVPQDIGRVLLNLFNNAFYAVKPPNPLKGELWQPLVSVKTRKIKLSNNNAAKNSPSGDGGIEIIVSDNGNGIPQNIIDKIFQPFFTTKPTGHGTGLGLSLAYDIITKEHNGTIKVESKEGEGSIFIIQLSDGKFN